MVKVKIYVYGRVPSAIPTLEFEARWAHVRDGCLVWGPPGEVGVEMHVPISRLEGFSIDRSNEQLPMARPFPNPQGIR
jgi:hypothetical protein